MNLYRRMIVLGLFGVIAVGLLGCSERSFMAAPYTASHGGALLRDGKDLIFPSLIDAGATFDEPLARFYLYTAPHGGADIRLYLSDEVEGPWRLHGTVVDEKVGRADHVSSPHAVWNDEAGELFLYVHAPNAQTIYCTSKDGVAFEYGGVCVTKEMISAEIDFVSRSASYARVFRYPLGEYGSEWTMTLTASGGEKSNGVDRNAIVLCTSVDGKEWVVRRAIIEEGNGGREYKSLDGCWIPIDGENYMVYGLRTRAEEKGERTEPVRLHLSKGDAEWRNWEYAGVFYEPTVGAPDMKAARGFLWVMIDGKAVLLYEAGQNREAEIGVLTLDHGKVTGGR